MKVSMETIEVSDEQRSQLANALDGKVSSRKATRIEFKEFIWTHGSSWEAKLEELDNPTYEDELEDLI